MFRETYWNYVKCSYMDAIMNVTKINFYIEMVQLLLAFKFNNS